MRKKNRKWLTQKVPSLVEQEDYFIKNGYQKTEAVLAKSGAPTLKYHTEKGEVFVHSAYDPEKEAEMIATQFEGVESKDVFLFVGIGLGYSLRAIMRHYPNNSLLLWEPEAEFLYRWWDTFDEEPKLWERVFVLTTESDNVLSRLKNSDMMHRKIHLVFSSFHEKVFQEKIGDFMSEYRLMTLEKREDFFSGIQMFDRQLLSNMKNMGKILSSPSVAEDTGRRYQGKTAVLVSAGPSLNEEIDHLKKIYEEGTAVIFACGSSVHTMLNNGIIPHALVAVDAGAPMQELMKPIIDGNYQSITLFFGDFAGFEALSSYLGPLIWLRSKHGIITSKLIPTPEDAVRFEGVVTVANITLELALHLGFSDIILVGQNFALRDNERYAKDMSYSNAEEMQFFDVEENKGLIVECLSVDGKKIKTLYGYQMMRAEMEELLAKHSGEANVYNTTRGGAAIQGTKYVELPILMKSLLTTKIVEKEFRFEIAGESVMDVRGLQVNLEKYDRAFNEVLDLLKDFYKDVEKIDTIYRLDEMNECFQRLNDRMEALHENPFARDFLLYVIQTHVKILWNYRQMIEECTDAPEKRKMMKERYGNFYQLLFATYVEFTPHYEELRKTLIDYIESKEKKPD